MTTLNTHVIIEEELSSLVHTYGISPNSSLAYNKSPEQMIDKGYAWLESYNRWIPTESFDGYCERDKKLADHLIYLETGII